MLQGLDFSAVLLPMACLTLLRAGPVAGLGTRDRAPAPALIGPAPAASRGKHRLSARRRSRLAGRAILCERAKITLVSVAHAPYTRRRRRGRVVEGTPLLRVQTGNRLEGSNPFVSATFRYRIRPTAPIGTFFLFVSKGVGRAIRPSETGCVTQNGSPNGLRLPSSAPRRPRDGVKQPRNSNGLPHSWGCPFPEVIRSRRLTRRRRAVRRTALWRPIPKSGGSVRSEPGACRKSLMTNRLRVHRLGRNVERALDGGRERPDRRGLLRVAGRRHLRAPLQQGRTSPRAATGAEGPRRTRSAC